MKSYQSNLKLGILGGGQLAQMLALEAQPLGLEVHILSEKEDDPARLVTHSHLTGSGHSEKDLAEFLPQVDLLTFESEFFDAEELIQLTSETSPYIFPAPQIMADLQNRQKQKALLQKFKIPTSPFMNVNSAADLELAFTKFKGRFVLKKAMGGYDGYGTYYVKSRNDLEKYQSLFPEQFIAEAFVEFKRELAISFARSRDLSFIEFPLVETHQTNSRCDWVVGPKKHPHLATIAKVIRKMLVDTNYIGVITFELFDTGKKLLINEIAPRVHNSAHYSQNALSQSQFLIHLFCGLGFPLKKPKLFDKQFCMVNLLGQSDQQPQLTGVSGALHWYGKSQNRLGRKMGHINYTGTSAEQLLKLALKERKGFQL
jgi:5-(carboxyamino)imidazole ribonucleotide synthase